MDHAKRRRQRAVGVASSVSAAAAVPLAWAVAIVLLASWSGYPVAAWISPLSSRPQASRPCRLGFTGGRTLRLASSVPNANDGPDPSVFPKKKMTGRKTGNANGSSRRSTQPKDTTASARASKAVKRVPPARQRPLQSPVVPERQVWRVFGVEVHPDLLSSTEPLEASSDEPESSRSTAARHASASNSTLHPAVLQAVRTRLRYPTLPVEDVTLVRRSIDARLKIWRSDGQIGPRYVYAVDVVMDPSSADRSNWPKYYPWTLQAGRLELVSGDDTSAVPTRAGNTTTAKPRVIIVGAGPAGLFCALQLVQSGLVTPIVLERGQPVEARGKDIGALMHRQQFDAESNFCFGEGGAGTWSDGKLTTRIGRNSDAVRTVLDTLVRYGAPSSILVEGAPHLGTDNLVRLLRNMRLDLRAMGGEIHFGSKVTGLLQTDQTIRGVDYVVHRETIERNTAPRTVSAAAASSRPSENGNNANRQLVGDAVVLATGHSARDVYEQLHTMGVQLQEKGFAVGYRVEHPQALINRIQYGQDWGPSVITGKSTTDGANDAFFALGREESASRPHVGVLPVPSYRLATNKAHDGEDKERGVYSFCMCPGGQIVPASTNPNELCVNGMSFSRRDSLWANSALVVTVDPQDKVLEPYRQSHGVLAGIEFQRDMERRAAHMGGGNLTVPVQRVTDFLAGRASTSAPSSSYRLGVKPSACHEIYPAPLVTALRHALVEHFDRQMPGYVCDDALLHAVETRTSSPVRIARDNCTLQAMGMAGLYPAGEGAGFAGGIVSAAVDGMAVANAILDNMFAPGNNTRLDRAGAVGTFY